MFNDTMIVQSAVSAFNNAALFAPAFLWWGVLAMPLFGLVYICGKNFMSHMGWSAESMQQRVTLYTVILAFAWLILMGGNYNVLRDGVTLLPMMNAAIAFVASVFIGSHWRELGAEKWGLLSGRARLRRVILIAVVLMAVGASDTHAWWGPMLQIGTVLAGFLIGRVARSPMRPVAGTLLVIMTIVTAMMMQPEYFRFGQLGNLSVWHLVFVMLVGLSAAATSALYNVVPCGRIHDSAYMKLKWMMRCVVALGCALVLLTESVPVLLGTCGAAFVMFAMSVWHAKMMPADLASRMLAITVGLFGVLTVMPAVSALGILYWCALPMGNVRAVRALL